MWIRRFILFHGKKHPSAMGAAEANAFLNYLAVERTVSAATQNQALSALLFLYKEVLHGPTDGRWKVLELCRSIAPISRIRTLVAKRCVLSSVILAGCS